MLLLKSQSRTTLGIFMFPLLVTALFPGNAREYSRAGHAEAMKSRVSGSRLRGHQWANQGIKVKSTVALCCRF
jgi:hypothetical protein